MTQLKQFNKILGQLDTQNWSGNNLINEPNGNEIESKRDIPETVNSDNNSRACSERFKDDTKENSTTPIYEETKNTIDM